MLNTTNLHENIFGDIINSDYDRISNNQNKKSKSKSSRAKVDDIVTGIDVPCAMAPYV